MWRYVQKTGAVISPEGEIVAHGYAGNGEHKNNPASQCVRKRGPLPTGDYVMAQLMNRHPKLGAYVIVLDPDSSNAMCGRGLFRIHGDSMAAPGTASEGCIVAPRPTRQQMWEDLDHGLRVVADMGDV